MTSISLNYVEWNLENLPFLLIFITETNRFGLTYFILLFYFIEVDVKHSRALSFLLSSLLFLSF